MVGTNLSEINDVQCNNCEVVDKIEQGAFLLVLPVQLISKFDDVQL
jgi:hypothetical protein